MSKRLVVRRIKRWRNHWRALVNYSHGYAWSCASKRGPRNGEAHLTAERQVGERLSEQDRAMYLLDMLCLDSLEVSIDHVDLPGGREGEISAWFGELKDLILAQARQLAEAERDTERLRDMLVSRGLSRAQITERLAALNPPDPPASPAAGSEAATEVEGDRGW